MWEWSGDERSSSSATGKAFNFRQLKKENHIELHSLHGVSIMVREAFISVLER